jgi:26S proteasome regulatory subunit N5
MSAGLLKPEKDFTKDADKLIPEAEALAKVRITQPADSYFMEY